MKLEQVTIENFRQYFGKQDPVFFSFTPDKNVTLIYGINGAGKSNLFKAINWCIYGNRVLDSEGEKKGEIANKEAIRNLRAGEKVTVRVQVNFHHKGEKYLLSRSIEYTKGINQYSEDEFTMIIIQSDGRSKIVDNPLGRINHILPENVRTYFLFDGEKIENFSKPSSASDVKNAIYNVLKLEVLERGREHLIAVSEEYQKELRKIANVELQVLLDEYETKKKQETSLIKRQVELDEQIELAKQKVREIDAALEGMKESRGYQKERERLESEKAKKEKELDECKEGIRKIVTGAITAINNKMYDKALVLLDSKRIKGEIPSNIREQFMQDILDKGVCICGRDFSENSKEHKHLLTLQHTTVSGALEEEVIGLTGSLRAIKSESEINMSHLSEYMRRSISVRDAIENLDTEISEVSQKLKGSRSENIERLEKQREGYKADESSYILEKGSNSIKLEQLSEKLRELDLKIQQSKKAKNEEKSLVNKRAIALKAANAIDSIYQRFADNMRSLIENRTKEIFDQLIWKDSQFKNVKLGDDYHLEVIDRWEQPASSELSAGERQILSLAFITAMAKESGEEAPIVMDTPFGRLSKKHRENITLSIPALTDQLILFITDEEMSEPMYKNLKPRIGESYSLNFDNKTGCTTIERV